MVRWAGVASVVWLAGCAASDEDRAWRHDVAGIQAHLRLFYLHVHATFAEAGELRPIASTTRPCAGGGTLEELDDGGLVFDGCVMGRQRYDGAVRTTENTFAFDAFSVQDLDRPDQPPTVSTGGYNTIDLGDQTRVEASFTIVGPGFDGEQLEQQYRLALVFDDVTETLSGSYVATLDDDVSPGGRREMTCTFADEDVGPLLDILTAPDTALWERLCPNAYDEYAGVRVHVQHREPMEPPGGIPLAFVRLDLDEPFLESEEVQPLTSEWRPFQVDPGTVMEWGVAEGGREEPRKTAICPPAYDGATFELVYVQPPGDLIYRLGCWDTRKPVSYE